MSEEISDGLKKSSVNYDVKECNSGNGNTFWALGGAR